jgi:hypothetical protein
MVMLHTKSGPIFEQAEKESILSLVERAGIFLLIAAVMDVVVVVNLGHQVVKLNVRVKSWVLQKVKSVKVGF